MCSGGLDYKKKKNQKAKYLVRNSLSCLFGVMALVDDIADFLAIHNEVNAVCGQCQECVMDMVQLREERGRKHFTNTFTV